MWIYRPDCGLQRIDHIVGNQPDLEMNNVVDWFVSLFSYIAYNHYTSISQATIIVVILSWIL